MNYRTKNQDICEYKDTKHKDANPFRWGAWLFLWVLIGFAVMIYWYASWIVSGWMIYGTYRLSKYCRSRYGTPPMLPPRFTALVYRSQLFQVFFVRAAQHPGYGIVLFIALVFFIFGFGSIHELFLNPVLDLEEMDIRTGVVEKVYQRKPTGRASQCGDRVYLRIQDGDLLRYHGILNEATIKVLYEVGKQQVTIWSQRRFESPPCRVGDWINQIQVGDRIVDPYVQEYHIKFKKLVPKRIIIFSTPGFLCLLWIWLDIRKKTPDLHKK